MLWKFNLICLFSLVISSCRSDKSKPIPPTVLIPTVSGCDTLHVTYSTSVKTILQNNCYSCHSTATAGGGLDLENFTSLKNYLNYQYHNDSIFGSKFSHIINQTGTVLYMPPTSKMTNCELSVIGTWIKAGAPQN